MRKPDMSMVREKGAALRKGLLVNGWPERTDNTRFIFLKPYGRVAVAYVKDKGFWMHLESDSRVGFGRDNDSALRALVRQLEPDVEEMHIATAAF